MSQPKITAEFEAQLREHCRTIIQREMARRPDATGHYCQERIMSPYSGEPSYTIFEDVLREECTKRDAELAARKVDKKAKAATGTETGRLFS